MKRIAILTLPLILFASFAWGHMTSPTLCDEGYYARGIGKKGDAAGCTQDVAGEGGSGAAVAFKTIQVDGIDAVADSSTDTLILNEGVGIKLEGSDPDTITITFDANFSEVADSIADGQIPDAIARDVELHTQSHDNADHSTNYETPANVLTAIGTHSANASSHHTATTSGDIAHDSTSGGTADNAHHNKSHDNTDHSTNYAVAGGAEHDGFSDSVGAEHLTPGDGLVENSGAVDVIKQTFKGGLIDSVTTADAYIPMGWANGECTVDKIVCRGATYTSTIIVYNDTDVIYAGLVCAVNTPGSETVQTASLTNATLADGAEVSFTVTATGGSDPTMLVVQAECN